MCNVSDIKSIKLYDTDESALMYKGSKTFPLEINYTKYESESKLSAVFGAASKMISVQKKMFLWSNDINKLKTLRDNLTRCNSNISISSTSSAPSTSPPISAPISTSTSPSTLKSSTSAPPVRNTPPVVTPITQHRREYIELENKINILNKEINDIDDEIEIINRHIFKNWDKDLDQESQKYFYTHKSLKNGKGEFIAYWEDQVDFPLIELINKQTKLYNQKKKLKPI